MHGLRIAVFFFLTAACPEADVVIRVVGSEEVQVQEMENVSPALGNRVLGTGGFSLSG
jgi:hypothetical protein